MTGPAAPARSTAGPPPDRYGRRDPRRDRRAALIGGALLAVLILAWAGWVALRQARTPVSWTSGTFTAVDDGQARLRFTVTTDPGRTAVCTVRMFSSGLTEVGRMDVTVGPSSERTIQAVVTVPTFQLAASGRVRACAVLPPG